MLWFRHPQPLLSTKAIAVQVVARKAQAMRDTQVIIVEKIAATADAEGVRAPLPVEGD